MLAREHKVGMRLTKRGEFAAAVPHFERSYAFFERHVWLDQWRAVVLLSSARLSYREMALVNVAFCLAQTGQGDQAVAAYRRALAEFPESVIAQSALRMAEAFQRRPPDEPG